MNHPIFTQFRYSDSDSPHHEHYHLSGEMVFVEEGEAEFVISGKIYRAEKNSILFINSYYRELPLPHVTLNDRLAAQRAVEYLAAAGHRRIGALMKFDDGQGHLRFAGYLSACRKLGIPAGDHGTVWLDTQAEQDLADYRERILKTFRDCTAVFCYNDKLAFQLEGLFRKEGIRVPDDISLISIDDSDLAELSDTRLTSVHHPADRLGEKAAENLLSVMRDGRFDGTYEFEARIVERDSVKRLAE